MQRDVSIIMVVDGMRLKGFAVCAYSPLITYAPVGPFRAREREGKQKNDKLPLEKSVSSIIQTGN